MIPGRLILIAPLALVPALIACHSAPVAVPLNPAARAAVTADPGDTTREALAQSIDAVFTAPGAGETRAVVVWHDGKLIAERYAPGYDRNTRFISWSMAKTVTGVLIGMLVSDGRLRLDSSVPIPLWQRPGDPRGEITLRQLLQMRSGLRHVEGGDPPYLSDEVRMLFLDGRDDMARYAEAQPLQYDPGQKWVYSTNTAVILADLAARVLAPNGAPEMRRRVVLDYLRTRLFDPVGMHSAVPEFDAAGTMVGGSSIHATARDWALFGEFLRHRGAAGGVQLVPRQWIDFMTSPSPRESQYGAQIWLNRPATSGRPSLFPDRGPADLFACEGHLGQYVLVSPSRRLTVVRLGMTPEDHTDLVAARLGDVVALFR
ncbi:serine hydrolase domain-containing protein [Novosphingobium sp.]|uniref:serine hydrolase domain-containing protein n=1 Tax=Novosphingobium sp. TaxID=1874826 RepID=UPI003D0D324F